MLNWEGVHAAMEHQDEKTTVVIVEDGGLYRELLKVALSRYPHIDVVGDFGDGEHALREIPRLNPRVAVLDIGTRRRDRRPECLPVRGARDFAFALFGHAARGFTLHLHTNGHNRKSWLVSAACAAAGLTNHRRTVISLGSATHVKSTETADSQRAMAKTEGLALGRVSA